jgi:hypothetical protein
MRIVPWRSLRLRLIVLLVLVGGLCLTAATALEIPPVDRARRAEPPRAGPHPWPRRSTSCSDRSGAAPISGTSITGSAELARTHRNVADIEILLPVRDQWRLLGSSGRATPTEPIALDRLAMELDQPMWQLLPGSSHLGSRSPLPPRPTRDRRHPA